MFRSAIIAPLLAVCVFLSLMVPGATAQNLNPDMVKKIDGALPAKATAAPAKKHKVLVYTNAAGFVHSSIPYGAYAVEAMGKKTGAYESVTSADPAVFDDLSAYSAIVMVNTTGDWLMPRNPGGEPKNDPNKPDPNFEAKLAKWKAAKAEYDVANAAAKTKVESRRKNILDFLANGGGLVGFHAASDAQYNWKEFGQIMGGYFWGHPWHEKVRLKLDDPKHPLLAVFKGENFDIADEIYQFNQPYSRANLRVLLSLDFTQANINKAKGVIAKAKRDGNKLIVQDKGVDKVLVEIGEGWTETDIENAVNDKIGIHRKDRDHAVAWVRDYHKGHVFYSSLGHREEIYWNPAILQFYLDGIQFALGDLKADATPSQPAKVLFDGKSLDAWNFKKDGWVIEDGTMALNKGGDYIWSKEQFGDFEMNLEFKVSKGCNSGIFFRTDPKNPVNGGFEIQVYDSAGEKPHKHNTGSLYDARPASKMTVKPAGEWNTFKLICKGPQVTVYINGEKVNEANLDDWKEANKNPDGSKNKFPTALKDLPRTGHIGFQDHGQPVWYRNVTINPL